MDHPSGEKRNEICMDDITETLDDRIRTVLEEISKNKIGSEQCERAINQVVDLYRLRLEEQKIESEREDKNYARKFKLGLQTAGLIVPNAIALGTVLMGFNFEKTGVLKSRTMQKVLGWVKPGNLVRLFKI